MHINLSEQKESYAVRAALTLLIAFIVAGCASSPSSKVSSDANGVKARPPNSTAGQQELIEARRMIDAGDYTVVIPRLLQIVTKNPNSQAAIDSRYFLGVSYHGIKSYRDAIDMFNEYLRLSPQGKYAKDCTAQVTALTQEYEKNFWTSQRLDARIAELTEMLRKTPDNLDAQWELADLSWKRGDYENAAKLYVSIITQHPDRANDPLVVSRIERQSSGQYLALTPTEIERREIERDPVGIVNLSSFRSGNDLLTRENMYYVVTGQAVNRSDSVLYGVQVIITIYGFGNVVYDTHTVTIGRLNPGELRAFSVRFTNFDTLDNISRYDAVGTFER